MSQKRDREGKRGTVFTEAAAYLSIGGRDKQKPSEQTERSWSRQPQRLMVYITLELIFIGLLHVNLVRLMNISSFEQMSKCYDLQNVASEGNRCGACKSDNLFREHFEMK